MTVLTEQRELNREKAQRVGRATARSTAGFMSVRCTWSAINETTKMGQIWQTVAGKGQECASYCAESGKLLSSRLPNRALVRSSRQERERLPGGSRVQFRSRHISSLAVRGLLLCHRSSLLSRPVGLDGMSKQILTWTKQFRRHFIQQKQTACRGAFSNICKVLRSLAEVFLPSSSSKHSSKLLRRASPSLAAGGGPHAGLRGLKEDQAPRFSRLSSLASCWPRVRKN